MMLRDGGESAWLCWEGSAWKGADGMGGGGRDWGRGGTGGNVRCHRENVNHYRWLRAATYCGPAWKVPMSRQCSTPILGNLEAAW